MQTLLGVIFVSRSSIVGLVLVMPPCCEESKERENFIRANTSRAVSSPSRFIVVVVPHYRQTFR
ncbi:unnamed protein product, partial [Amoebophrya sp. A120]|eukprot:GSA120T00011673001.1